MVILFKNIPLDLVIPGVWYHNTPLFWILYSLKLAKEINSTTSWFVTVKLNWLQFHGRYVKAINFRLLLPIQYDVEWSDKRRHFLHIWVADTLVSFWPRRKKPCIHALESTKTDWKTVRGRSPPLPYTDEHKRIRSYTQTTCWPNSSVGQPQLLVFVSIQITLTALIPYQWTGFGNRGTSKSWCVFPKVPCGHSLNAIPIEPIAGQNWTVVQSCAIFTWWATEIGISLATSQMEIHHMVTHLSYV